MIYGPSSFGNSHGSFFATTPLPPITYPSFGASHWPSSIFTASDIHLNDPSHLESHMFRELFSPLNSMFSGSESRFYSFGRPRPRLSGGLHIHSSPGSFHSHSLHSSPSSFSQADNIVDTHRFGHTQRLGSMLQRVRERGAYLNSKSPYASTKYQSNDAFRQNTLNTALSTGLEEPSLSPEEKAAKKKEKVKKESIAKYVKSLQPSKALNEDHHDLAIKISDSSNAVAEKLFELKEKDQSANQDLKVVEHEDMKFISHGGQFWVKDKESNVWLNTQTAATMQADTYTKEDETSKTTFTYLKANTIKEGKELFSTDGSKKSVYQYPNNLDVYDADGKKIADQVLISELSLGGKAANLLSTVDTKERLALWGAFKEKPKAFDSLDSILKTMKDGEQLKIYDGGRTMFLYDKFGNHAGMKIALKPDLKKTVDLPELQRVFTKKELQTLKDSGANLDYLSDMEKYKKDFLAMRDHVSSHPEVFKQLRDEGLNTHEYRYRIDELFEDFADDKDIGKNAKFITAALNSDFEASEIHQLIARGGFTVAGGTEKSKVELLKFLKDQGVQIGDEDITEKIPPKEKKAKSTNEKESGSRSTLAEELSELFPDERVIGTKVGRADILHELINGDNKLPLNTKEDKRKLAALLKSKLTNDQIANHHKRGELASLFAVKDLSPDEITAIANSKDAGIGFVTKYGVYFQDLKKQGMFYTSKNLSSFENAINYLKLKKKEGFNSGVQIKFTQSTKNPLLAMAIKPGGTFTSTRSVEQSF